MDINRKFTNKRTYKRRPPEHREIPDVDRLCLLCLSKCEKDKATSIFADNSGAVASSLSLRIMICVGLDLKQDEYLPNQICSNCLHELQRCYDFRKRCEASYSKLKSHIIAVKMKQFNKEIQNKIQRREEEDNAQIYVVNVDETVKMCGEIPSTSKDNLLTDVAREDYVDTPLQIVESENSESLNSEIVKNCDGLSEKVNISNELISTREIPNVTKEKVTEIIVNSNSPILKKFEEIQNECKVLNQPNSGAVVSDEELSSFLIDVLTQSGVIMRQGDGLVVADELPQVEIETGDGAQVVMEVMEEDDEVVQTNTKTATAILTAKDADSLNSRVCGECGREFSCAGAVRRHHRARHLRLRPYACPHCPRTFAQKEVCTRHQYLHQERRPFVCSVCGAAYTQREGLTAHSRSHLPHSARSLALHPCPRCHKLFLHQSGVSRHMASHLGRVYTCACGRRYTDSCALRRHCSAAGHIPANSHTDTGATGDNDKKETPYCDIKLNGDSLELIQTKSESTTCS